MSILDEVRVSDIKEQDLASLTILSPEHWGDIKYAFAEYIKWEFARPIKITYRDEIISTGCIIYLGDVAYLGHIIVKKTYRKQGIGGMMVESLLEIAKNHHMKSVNLIASEMGEPVYKKHGAHVVIPYHSYHKLDRTEHTNDEKASILDRIRWEKLSSSIVLAGEEDYEDIYQLVCDVYVEDRRACVKGKLSNCFIYKENGIVKGAYLPDFIRGPVLATEEQAGLSLLQLAMQFKDDITIPKANKAAGKFLLENGYTLNRTMSKMTWGPDGDTKYEQIFCYIGGNIG